MKKLERFLTLLLAQGFGTGLIPVAPGTFGSLLGCAWFVLLLATGNIWAFLAGQMISFILSVWLCGKAERILKKPDPGSVVLDEIVAIPLCFTIPIFLYLLKFSHFPEMTVFFGATTWWIVALGFALFRVFDIAKPWPIGASQTLPGGWGITADDLLAALATSLILTAVIFIFVF